jgi:uncharacterized protein involved in exopolysaccharide biosynthesis
MEEVHQLIAIFWEHWRGIVDFAVAVFLLGVLITIIRMVWEILH